VTRPRTAGAGRRRPSTALASVGVSAPADVPPAKRAGMQLVARAAEVLRALEAAPQGLTLSVLSVAVGLPKSTVHRIVAALEAEDFVGSAATGRLRLGRGLAQLGAAARGALRQELRPILVRAAQELEETVDLSILDGGEARFIDQIPSTHRLRAVSAVGVSFPLHSTANGKALLAALPPEQASALLPPRLSRDTRNTITSRRELWAELDRVREQGIAFDHEEHTDGICAVGAVVHDAYGIAGAISIPVPLPRFAARKDELVAALRLYVAEANEVLGG
jgi:DNA-binding IclR family transcriptional regulator